MRYLNYVVTNSLGNSSATDSPTDDTTHPTAGGADVYNGSTTTSTMRASTSPQDTSTSSPPVGNGDGSSTIGTVVTLVDLGRDSALAGNADTLDQLQVLLVIVKCLIIGFIILAAILGNMLVIVSVMQHRKLR